MQLARFDGRVCVCRYVGGGNEFTHHFLKKFWEKLRKSETRNNSGIVPWLGTGTDPK